ncbi:MAG: tRNA (adenosine(37)-N6)-dimethylallyltransferase MiaA [Eubacterium sp.]|nr:tRNA (adenosine(37)-N6)-dimethylallyltransferase MiaA [Eubacterium sp.]
MRKIIVVAGPTAVGKTEYAIEVAKKINGEIVSCDSMQLYKYMDIGSAKPTAEERAQVYHYLVDEIDPKDAFSVAEYQKLAKAAIEEIFEKGKIPVIAGGTGLYLNSLLYNMDFGGAKSDDQLRRSLEEMAEKEGVDALHQLLAQKDPEAAGRIHKNNVKKVIRAIEAIELNGKVEDFNNLNVPTDEYEVLMLCLNRDREELYDRINRRVDILMDMGLLEEVKSLIDMGFTADDIAMKGIGYKEIIGYFDGEYDLETAVDLVKRNTRRYAKRQITWFKRYENMKWFNLSEEGLEDVISWVERNM